MKPLPINLNLDNVYAAAAEKKIFIAVPKTAFYSNDELKTVLNIINQNIKYEI